MRNSTPVSGSFVTEITYGIREFEVAICLRKHFIGGGYSLFLTGDNDELGDIVSQFELNAKRFVISVTKDPLTGVEFLIEHQKRMLSKRMFIQILSQNIFSIFHSPFFRLSFRHY